MALPLFDPRCASLVDALHVASVLGRHQQDLGGPAVGTQAVGPLSIEMGGDPGAEMVNLAVVFETKDALQDVEPLLAVGDEPEGSRGDRDRR